MLEVPSAMADPVPIRSGPSAQYGQREALETAQRLLPMAAPADTLDAPTARPSEPLTAGAPVGAGPGPEVLTAPTPMGDELDLLRAIYRQFPDEELRELIEDAEDRAF